MYLNVQNPTALDNVTFALAGAYRLFIPTPDSAMASDPNKPIHLGHVRSPAETTNITTKDIDTAVYGAVRTALALTTKIEETGTFESASANDLLVRSLWAGSKAAHAANTAASAVAFQASHAYALNDLVVPTIANGHYYRVTAAGTSAATAPAFPTTSGGVVVSGGATFTEQGSTAASGLTVIANNHGSTPGMLIDVYLSAITGGNTEIFVAPSASLRGDGYGAGRDGTNETTLKFAYTLLAPGGYEIPTALGDFGSQQVNGGYNILGIAPGTENPLIDALVAGFNTP